MGFLFGCILIGMVSVFIWSFLTKKDERKKAFEEYSQNPTGYIFVSIWVLCCITTFIGVFVPIVGTIEILDSGWELWQATGVASLLGFIVYMSPLGRHL